MKYSAKGKTGFVFSAIGILGLPSSLLSGELSFSSALLGSFIWFGIGSLLIYYDRKNGGKKEKPPKPVPKPIVQTTHVIHEPAMQSQSFLSVDSAWYQWENEHESLEQLKRMRRASSKEFMCRNIETCSGEADFLGRDGDTYFTTLSSCTCPDFEKRGLPCKHMYYLASKMNLIYFEDYLK